MDGILQTPQSLNDIRDDFDNRAKGLVSAYCPNMNEHEHDRCAERLVRMYRLSSTPPSNDPTHFDFNVIFNAQVGSNLDFQLDIMRLFEGTLFRVRKLQERGQYNISFTTNRGYAYFLVKETVYTRIILYKTDALRNWLNSVIYHSQKWKDASQVTLPPYFGPVPLQHENS